MSLECVPNHYGDLGDFNCENFNFSDIKYSQIVILKYNSQNNSFFTEMYCGGAGTKPLEAKPFGVSLALFFNTLIFQGRAGN